MAIGAGRILMGPFVWIAHPGQIENCSASTPAAWRVRIRSESGRARSPEFEVLQSLSATKSPSTRGRIGWRKALEAEMVDFA